jgi:hypothetical protein
LCHFNSYLNWLQGDAGEAPLLLAPEVGEAGEVEESASEGDRDIDNEGDRKGDDDRFVLLADAGMCVGPGCDDFAGARALIILILAFIIHTCVIQRRHVLDKDEELFSALKGNADRTEVETLIRDGADVNATNEVLVPVHVSSPCGVMPNSLCNQVAMYPLYYDDNLKFPLAPPLVMIMSTYS